MTQQAAAPAAGQSVLRVAGHFGEWIQGRIGPAGPVALVTVHCPAVGAQAPAPGSALFDPTVLAGFAARLGLAAPLPVAVADYPAGAGTGASTATLVASARAAGYAGPAEALAAACLATEGASDPLMFDMPDGLLWASRTGQVLRRLPRPPQCEIIGGLWGAPEQTDPADDRFDDITDLAGDWARACAAGDLPGAARVAQASALRCTARRGTAADPTGDLARDLGALGWLRAHTGSARGLIFAPGAVPDRAPSVLRAAGFTRLLQFRTGLA